MASHSWSFEHPTCSSQWSCLLVFSHSSAPRAQQTVQVQSSLGVGCRLEELTSPKCVGFHPLLLTVQFVYAWSLTVLSLLQQRAIRKAKTVQKQSTQCKRGHSGFISLQAKVIFHIFQNFQDFNFNTLFASHSLCLFNLVSVVLVAGDDRH